MNEELTGVFYEDRPVKSTFQAGDEDETHHQVAVTFADDKKPEVEVMHEEEWKAMKKTTADPNRMVSFLESTYALQGRILNEIERFNPRWDDTGRIVQRIADKMNDVRDQLVNNLFSVLDWRTKLTVKDVTDAVPEPKLDGVSEVTMDILKVLALHSIPVIDLLRGTVFQEAMKTLDELQKQALEQKLGIPYEGWRLDDIIQVIEEANAKAEAEKPAEEPVEVEAKTEETKSE